MPLEGQRLVIEPSYAKAQQLMDIGAPEEPDDDKAKLRNVFYSTKKGRDVYVFDDLVTGRVDWGAGGRVNHFDLEINTIGCSVAWGIEQEHNAVQLLAGMIRHHQMKQYLLTGMFLESSQRSKICYAFRKLRPTIALSMRSDRPRVLAALCMHPIGYYRDSWAGAMCPTDDVVAHLSLMRGDEHMFWKRCTQHAPWRPEAGL
jgi:hypothetical protein